MELLLISGLINGVVMVPYSDTQIDPNMMVKDIIDENGIWNLDPISNGPLIQQYPDAQI